MHLKSALFLEKSGFNYLAAGNLQQDGCHLIIKREFNHKRLGLTAPEGRHISSPHRQMWVKRSKRNEAPVGAA